MGGLMKDVQFKELDSMVWSSGCEASKNMDEVKVARVDGSVKAGEPAPAPTSLETIQEFAKEIGSSNEQIQAQNGLDDALKRRLNDYKVEFGSFDLLTDNKVMEKIQKYSNRPQLSYIYFKGSACDLRQLRTFE